MLSLEKLERKPKKKSNASAFKKFLKIEFWQMQI
jgi:hypothetical protein